MRGVARIPIIEKALPIGMARFIDRLVIVYELVVGELLLDGIEAC
jgi:hypothetical protein